jgi:hypothetical protein
MRAARFFGVPQPKISYINNGKIEKISSDYLIGLLAKTGGDFRYSFRQPSKKQAAERHLRVRTNFPRYLRMSPRCNNSASENPR